MTQPVTDHAGSAGPATLPPVRATVEVAVSHGDAFRAFTNDFDRWWPRRHHIGAADMAEAVIEPRTGGRFFERGVDGSECSWGEVLEWDPPHRLVLAWGLDGTWAYRPGAENASRVEVSFTPVEGGRTRVELVHSGFEAHGDTGVAVRGGVGSAAGGWPGLVGLYRAFAEGGRSE